MKHSLDHLPASRRQHLADIVAILRDEVEQVTGFSNGKKKHARILKIVLFGSHSTGKWVNDPAHGYVSDYDILVIINNTELLHEYQIWDTAEDRISLKVRPPLNILVHSLPEVNDAIAKGNYFFTDIRRGGIILYESTKKELAEPGNLTPEEYKTIAEEQFEHWLKSGEIRYEGFKRFLEDGHLRDAAFDLHQASERFYACFLLVLTNYKPSTHNLKLLNSLAISQQESLSEIFPQNNKHDRRCFQLLKQAYVDARYSKHYKITEEELSWLAERVTLLQQRVEQLCQEKIQSFDL